MSGKKQVLINYIKFAVSSLCGTAVDMFLLWLCSDYLFPQGYFGEYLISPFISFEGAVVTNYIVARHFVWRDRVRYEPMKARFIRFIGYNVSCLSGFAVKMGFLLILARLFDWDVLVCNLVALIFSGIFNFAIQEFFVFRIKRQPATKDMPLSSADDPIIEDEESVDNSMGSL